MSGDALADGRGAGPARGVTPVYLTVLVIATCGLVYELRRGHAGELPARRLGHAVLDGHRRLPLGDGPRRVALEVRRARPRAALRRGRARRRARRRPLGAAPLPRLRPSPAWFRLVLYGSSSLRSAPSWASRSRCSCASSRRPSSSRTSSRGCSPSTTSARWPRRSSSRSCSCRTSGSCARRSLFGLAQRAVGLWSHVAASRRCSGRARPAARAARRRGRAARRRGFVVARPLHDARRGGALRRPGRLRAARRPTSASCSRAGARLPAVPQRQPAVRLGRRVPLPRGARAPGAGARAGRAAARARPRRRRRPRGARGPAAPGGRARHARRPRPRDDRARARRTRCSPRSTAARSRPARHGRQRRRLRLARRRAAASSTSPSSTSPTRTTSRSASSTRRASTALARRTSRPTASVAVQTTSPLFARQSFWCVVRTIEAAGFTSRPTTPPCRRSASGASCSRARAPFEVARAACRRASVARRDDALRALFVLRPGHGAACDVEVNRLNNQMLVRYYEGEWQALETDAPRRVLAGAAAAPRPRAALAACRARTARRRVPRGASSGPTTAAATACATATRPGAAPTHERRRDGRSSGGGIAGLSAGVAPRARGRRRLRASSSSRPRSGGTAASGGQRRRPLPVGRALLPRPDAREPRPRAAPRRRWARSSRARRGRRADRRRGVALPRAPGALFYAGRLVRGALPRTRAPARGPRAARRASTPRSCDALAARATTRGPPRLRDPDAASSRRRGPPRARPHLDGRVAGRERLHLAAPALAGRLRLPRRLRPDLEQISAWAGIHYYAARMPGDGADAEPVGVPDLARGQRPARPPPRETAAGKLVTRTALVIDVVSFGPGRRHRAAPLPGRAARSSSRSRRGTPCSRSRSTSARHVFAPWRDGAPGLLDALVVRAVARRERHAVGAGRRNGRSPRVGQRPLRHAVARLRRRDAPDGARTTVRRCGPTTSRSPTRSPRRRARAPLRRRVEGARRTPCSRT